MLTADYSLICFEDIQELLTTNTFPITGALCSITSALNLIRALLLVDLRPSDHSYYFAFFILVLSFKLNR